MGSTVARPVGVPSAAIVGFSAVSIKTPSARLTAVLETTAAAAEAACWLASSAARAGAKVPVARRAIVADATETVGAGIYLRHRGFSWGIRNMSEY